MKRNTEFKYLILILFLISTGFSLAYAGFLDGDTPSVLMSQNGILDISGYFLIPFPNALYGILFAVLFLLLYYSLRLALPEADPFILPAVALLSGIGAIMIFRLSPDLALARNNAIQALLSRNPNANVTDNVLTLARLGIKHFIFLVSGALVMIATIHGFTQRIFSRFSSKRYVWVFAAALLTFATLLFGKEINGRRLWLFGFQSVELVKLLLLFFIAGYIYEKGKGLATYKDSGFKYWLNYAGPFVAMWFFGIFPIFIQRDLGPTFLIFLLFLFLLYSAGSRITVIILFILFIICSGYLSYSISFPPVVRERFDMLSDPFGLSESISRSLWALSSGGIFGQGFGYGQPYRIPVVQSDFSFTAICEEMGFIGGMVIIFAYALLIHRCFRIALRTENHYKRILVMGIGTLLGLQAFTIIGGNLGVIPMTGITLPFVSYGGSSMFICFLMMGIVLRVSGEK